MKEFLVAAERADDDEKPPVEFKLRDPDKTVDGKKVPGAEQVLTAHFPGDGQLAAFMATNSSFSSTPERVAGVVNFFVSILSEEDHSYIVSRLFDRHDPFGTKHVMDILEHLIGEWTGRPTESSSGSTPQRPVGGRKSKPPTPALT